MTNLKKTSLYEDHLALKAKMGPYAGFSMPLQYSSVKEEALSVRSNVGVFDVSHMGEFFIHGPDAVEFVDYLMTNDFASAPINKAVYSPLCRPDGTVIDDVIAYKLQENEVMVCVNAANIEKDWQWFNQHIEKFNCELVDEGQNLSLLAIQGPKVDETLQKLGLKQAVELESFDVRKTRWLEHEVILAKTGYTGERGVEIFCSHQCAISLWRDLLSLGVTPCGLVARDLLRIEACYPLYGHEIDDTTTPLDSALKWSVKLDKKDFIGKKFLSTYTPKLKLIKISLEKGIPRAGHALYLGDQCVGKITSGTMSVVKNKGVAMAHIEKSVDDNHQSFEVEMRGRKYQATRQKNSFLKG